MATRAVTGFLAALAMAAALLTGAGSSSACACGPSARFLVAHGTSPHGAPWRIKVAERPGSAHFPKTAEFQFSSGKAEEDKGLGYFTSFPLPIPPSFVVDVTTGDGVYPELEADTSGFARARAVRLVLKMSAGPPIEIETQRAPEKLRARFPWLRGLVFFDQFYPAEVEPLALDAYGRDGRLLDRLSL